MATLRSIVFDYYQCLFHIYSTFDQSVNWIPHIIDERASLKVSFQIFVLCYHIAYVKLATTTSSNISQQRRTSKAASIISTSGDSHQEAGGAREVQQLSR